MLRDPPENVREVVGLKELRVDELYRSMRQHTSAYVFVLGIAARMQGLQKSMRQHTSACVRIRQHLRVDEFVHEEPVPALRHTHHQALHLLRHSACTACTACTACSSDSACSCCMARAGDRQPAEFSAEGITAFKALLKCY
jgi:hypothetical protein